MKRMFGIALAGLIAGAVQGHTAPKPCAPEVVKVPCRDMGDGRILVDSGYLPDSFKLGTSRYDIIHTAPVSMRGEWANLICTLRIN